MNNYINNICKNFKGYNYHTYNVCNTDRCEDSSGDTHFADMTKGDITML